MSPSLRTGIIAFACAVLVFAVPVGIYFLAEPSDQKTKSDGAKPVAPQRDRPAYSAAREAPQYPNKEMARAEKVQRGEAAGDNSSRKVTIPGIVVPDDLGARPPRPRDPEPPPERSPEKEAAVVAEPARKADPAEDEPTTVPGKLLKELVPGYETRLVNGFTMLLSTQAVSEANKDKGQPFRALLTEFDGLVKVLPPGTLKPLRRVRIWIEWDNIDRANPRALAKYYGGKIWKLDGSAHPLKSRAIEVLSLKKLMEEKDVAAGQARLVLLHELAHAVHHVVLPRGFNNPGVVFAYNQAMDRRLYDQVRDDRGGVGPAYAATSAAEYFAELTCAYLDRCQYFPFARDELREHDPTGYRLMESVWGKVAEREPEEQLPKEAAK